MNKLKTLNGGISMYEYCVMFDRIEITHSKKINGKVKVLCKDINSGASLICLLPGCVLSSVDGFNKDDINMLIDFCRHNESTILNVSTQGGLANAKYL